MSVELPILKPTCEKTKERKPVTHISSSNTKSISKALAILSTFDNYSPYQRLSDISAKLGLNTSTVSRHLSTMLDCGFLERDNDTGYYHLGVQVISLAGVALHSYEVYRHAYPVLQDLSHKLGLHCYLGIPRKNEVVHLLSIGEEHTIELLTPVGYHHPMYCSGMGRAILAHIPQEEATEILRADTSMVYAPDTKTNITEIERELKKISRYGYSVIVNELTAGKASIAAPIFGKRREVVAAISMLT